MAPDRVTALIPVTVYADPAAGEKKSQLCVLCHRPNFTMAWVPTLEGQTREYLYNQMKAFKENRRSDAAMQTNVMSLSDKDMRDIADYFSSQQPLRESFALDAEKVAAGKLKAADLMCASCHMPNFSGKQDAARLAGMHPKYMAHQIGAFSFGSRRHPRIDAANKISPEDAEALAQYFAQLN